MTTMSNAGGTPRFSVQSYASGTRSSATAEIARDVDDVDSRSLKVIRCCANRRGIYDFLLALNSNLASIFNRSGDITPSLHIHIHLSCKWNWKETHGRRRTCFDARVPKTLDYPAINFNPR